MDLVQIDRPQPRLPEWLRKGKTHFQSVTELKHDLRRLNLNTVCESARCPNIHECFHRGAATFMILGNLCTRGCAFLLGAEGLARQTRVRYRSERARQRCPAGAGDESALRRDHERESR